MLDSASSQQTIAVSWEPQPGPQTAFIHLPTQIEEVLYGGARGGGKTDAVIGYLLIQAERHGAHFTGIFFRRELTQLEGVIKRTKQLYPKHGAVYQEAKKIWTFPGGAQVHLRHCERDEDAEKVQGWEVQCVAIEEAGNFPNWETIALLRGILRSSHGVPCRLIMTANPGGPGTSWIRERFIEPAPLGYTPLWSTVKYWDDASKSFQDKQVCRMYIPARVTDNPQLLRNDPDYVGRLSQTGGEAQVRAWLMGDWFVVPGAYFPEFNINKHVIKSCKLPDHWVRFRAGDWGSAKPFAFYWIAVASENWNAPDGHVIPKGALVFYREWYGVQLKPEAPGYVANKGVRMFAEEVGAGIAERERGDPKIAYGVLDPSAFSRDGGYSIEERLIKGARDAKGRVAFRRADNSRTASMGRGGGWDAVRSRLVGEPMQPGAESRPMMYFMDCCIHAIRTFPALQSDKLNPEDVDTEGEDHAADAIRYGCMSRPYMRPTPADKKPMTTIDDVTLNALWGQLNHEATERRV